MFFRGAILITVIYKNQNLIISRFCEAALEVLMSLSQTQSPGVFSPAGVNCIVGSWTRLEDCGYFMNWRSKFGER